MNQVMGGTEPEISRKFGGDFRGELLTVNLRTEADSECLRKIIEERVEEMVREGIAMKACAKEAFRPGQPVPVERVTACFSRIEFSQNASRGLHILTHYLRFCANVARIKPERATRVAVTVRNTGLIVPPSSGGAAYELSAIASQLRDWAGDSAIAEQHCTTFLLTENLNDLHPLVSNNPQTSRIAVPLPEHAQFLPDLLTPGAAEALSVKLYRALRTGAAGPAEALAATLRDYQPPVSPAIIEAQIALAVAETTDLSFVPERFR